MRHTGTKAPPEVTTILLTDDEAGVRGPLRRILEDCGYRVIEAGGGEEALAVAEGFDGPIHLLLTDVVMPGMSGGELASRLGEGRPSIKVLFMSGHSPEAVATNGNLFPGRRSYLNRSVPAIWCSGSRRPLGPSQCPAAVAPPPQVTVLTVLSR